MTRVDVMVTVAIVILIAVFVIPAFIPMDATDKSHVPEIMCISNLKEVSLAFHNWADDHNNQYPMTVSVANGGAMELIATGNVAACFQVMSNELSMPKILICPYEKKHFPAANFTTDFNNSNISYFLNLDARKAYPQELLSGDDNFAINGTPVKSGLLLLSTNTAISWTAERHVHRGNLSFADGSIAEESSSGLRNSARMSVEGTDITTNRMAIP